MDVVFKTIKDANKWSESEEHQVIVDGKIILSQRDSIEPEDVRFYRDLVSPHDCETVLKLVIQAVKDGEEINFHYEETVDE